LTARWASPWPLGKSWT